MGWVAHWLINSPPPLAHQKPEDDELLVSLLVVFIGYDSCGMGPIWSLIAPSNAQLRSSLTRLRGGLAVFEIVNVDRYFGSSIIADYL